MIWWTLQLALNHWYHIFYFQKKKLIERLVIKFFLKGAIRSSYGCAIPFSCVELYATGNARPRSQSVKYQIVFNKCDYKCPINWVAFLLGILPRFLLQHVRKKITLRFTKILSNVSLLLVAKGVIPPLKSPYGDRKRPPLQRHMSVPVREKNLPETLQEQDETEQPASAFNFS